ncbi:MAG: hypothetical protein ABSA70_14115 [Terriglobia bacterium]
MQREFASGLDPTLNRLYHSRLFRWMTPDEFTGGPTDAVNASVGGPGPTPPGPLPYAAGGAYIAPFAMCAAHVLFCEGIKLKPEIPIQRA